MLGEKVGGHEPGLSGQLVQRVKLLPTLKVLSSIQIVLHYSVHRLLGQGNSIKPLHNQIREAAKTKSSFVSGPVTIKLKIKNNFF